VDARDAMDAYFTWVGHRIPFVSVRGDGPTRHFYVWGLKVPAISLRRVRFERDVELYEVSGGFLVAHEPAGTFSFRKEPTELVMELSGFAPRLPRFIYSLTHSLVHAIVMRAFCRFIHKEPFEERQP
jgi:hypothetical protein